ncbi:MAG: epoxyqueuosine reductase QueH [Lachnospiraceae bacterium]|nr:epoxyqueuosine reductase QueH [Lachnospiraceae bacterium]
MNKKNYARLCDEILKAPGTVDKTVVIQSCCAPCSSWCLTYLQGKIKVRSLYYNPNIVDKAEYELRQKELARLVDALSEEYPEASIEMIPGRPDTEHFLEAVRGLEKEPEGGKRCEVCFELRLREAARVAKEIGADYFSTTLTISPLKNAELINTIGERIAAEEGIAFLPSDFKKKDGYKKSVELSHKYGLYRQDYCGCPFSKSESEMRKKNNEETT